jgi:hypothetical protein
MPLCDICLFVNYLLTKYSSILEFIQ